MKIKNLLALAILGMSVFETGSVFAQSVTVDLSKEYQTIRGFGGMNHTTWIKDLNEDNREKAFGNAPGEIGLSILRMHVDPNPAKFNLEVPTAKFAEQKGAIVFASPWNAPDALLDPNSSKSRVLPSKYGDYVAHLNSFSTFMANNGVPLYAISVQNEPDIGEWTQWTSSEIFNFVKNYAQDINTRVIAPESFHFNHAYSDPILNDSLAAANLDIVGGHIYGGGLVDYPLAREKGKDVWMTEHLLGSGDGYVNDWNLAVTVGKEINDCMQANFNAYVWWYIRRSYGLITDDGNITDKGYVMSQFSKFVRPGAIRVGAVVTSAPNVYVTAYKTDTSFVMVAVNQNSTTRTLDFNIQNGTVEKLTQFTTSSTKKEVNDGDITVSGGLFTATVDGKSVTTFTTYSGNGGKKGNIKPTAFAGDDLTINDTGTGSQTITLDGSASSDSDGEIVNYSWSLKGDQIAWTPTAQATISIGDYDFVLTVTDNDGATATDTVHVSLKSLNHTEIWLEAECAETLGANWEIDSDTAASNGKYVTVTPGIQSLNSAAGSDGWLVLPFSVDTTGNFNLYARLNCPTSDDDSFWLKLDNGSFAMLNGLTTTGWQWLRLTSVWLTKGAHKLTFTYREDGAKLDKVFIANTGLVPTGTGSVAVNLCNPDSSTVGVNPVKLFDGYALEQNAPNPFKGKTRISFEIPKTTHVSLIVYNAIGVEVKQLAEKEYTSGKHTVEFDAENLPRGIYFCRFKADQFTSSLKMIKQGE